jgi:hypothetical protein
MERVTGIGGRLERGAWPTASWEAALEHLRKVSDDDELGSYTRVLRSPNHDKSPVVPCQIEGMRPRGHAPPTLKRVRSSPQSNAVAAFEGWVQAGGGVGCVHASKMWRGSGIRHAEWRYRNTNGSPRANYTLTMITETKPIERKGWRSTSVTRRSWTRTT